MNVLNLTEFVQYIEYNALKGIQLTPEVCSYLKSSNVRAKRSRLDLTPCSLLLVKSLYEHESLLHHSLG